MPGMCLHMMILLRVGQVMNTFLAAPFEIPCAFTLNSFIAAPNGTFRARSGIMSSGLIHPPCAIVKK